MQRGFSWIGDGGNEVHCNFSTYGHLKQTKGGLDGNQISNSAANGFCTAILAQTGALCERSGVCNQYSCSTQGILKCILKRGELCKISRRKLSNRASVSPSILSYGARSGEEAMRSIRHLLRRAGGVEMYCRGSARREGREFIWRRRP